MLLLFELGRKNDPLLRNAGVFRRLSQKAGGHRAGVEHPKHRCGHTLQHAHPGLPHLGVDFVDVVEHAHDRAARGQAELLAAGRGGQVPGAVVVDLVGGRDADDLFGKQRFCTGGHGVIVANHVLHKAATDSAGVAQIRDLHGRWVVGHHTVARAFGQAVQVDQDIDLVFDDQIGGLTVVHFGECSGLVAAVEHLAAQRRAVVVTGAITINLKAAAVVVAHEAQSQERRGVVAVVAGEVGDAQAALTVVGPCLGDQALTLGVHLARKGGDDGHVGGLVGTPQNVRARRFTRLHRAAIGMGLAQLRNDPLRQSPVGALQRHPQAVAGHAQVCARFVVALSHGLQAFFLLTQTGQHAPDVHFLVGRGGGGERMHQRGHGVFFAGLGFVVHHAQRHPGLGELGRGLGGLLGKRQGLGVVHRFEHGGGVSQHLATLGAF